MIWFKVLIIFFVKYDQLRNFKKLKNFPVLWRRVITLKIKIFEISLILCSKIFWIKSPKISILSEITLQYDTLNSLYFLWYLNYLYFTNRIIRTFNHIILSTELHLKSIYSNSLNHFDWDPLNRVKILLFADSEAKSKNFTQNSLQRSAHVLSGYFKSWINVVA